MKIKIIDYGYESKPFRAHENDAGADVYLKEDVVLPGNTTVKIPLGFGLQLPDGYAAYIYPRSGLASKGIVCELPPIDSGYTGEIHAIVTNNTEVRVKLLKGERIGQLVIMPIIIADFITEDIKERGANGFGSTGQ